MVRKITEHILQEIMSRHMLNKEMSGDSQNGFTKGIVADKCSDLLWWNWNTGGKGKYNQHDLLVQST